MEDYETKKWNCFYPIYIYADKSRMQGRRVSKEVAVKFPQTQVIAHILQCNKLPFKIEGNKKHPRDFFLRGRVKYRLKDDQGNFYQSYLKTSKPSVNIGVCDIICMLEGELFYIDF